MTINRIIRSLIGIVVGMFLISGIVEALEFGLVTAINGKPTTEPDVYYAIRNLGWFLGLKLVYNTAAAILGGFVTALIAGYSQMKHGITLAIIQTLAFGWALTQPEMSQWTPNWMWAALILLTFGGIIYGAQIQARRAVNT
jgi:hypothetical protein